MELKSYWKEDGETWKWTDSCSIFQKVNESSKQGLSPVSGEHKHQYVWLFVLKLKGNCCAKPLILLVLFNQARTTEMQMLMTAARDDLLQTYTLSLNNLRSPDETEHFCQIWSVPRGRIVGRICSDTSQTERLSLRLKFSGCPACSS